MDALGEVRTECVACSKGIEDGVAERDPLTLTTVHQNPYRTCSWCGGASGPPHPTVKIACPEAAELAQSSP